MADIKIQVPDFPETTAIAGVGNEYVVVTKADGKTYRMKTQLFKQQIGGGSIKDNVVAADSTYSSEKIVSLITDSGGDLTESIPLSLSAGKTLGKLVGGDTIPAGLDFNGFIRFIGQETQFPTFVNPSFNITPSITGALKEVGTFLTNYSITGNLNRGEIKQPWDNTVQGFRSGAAEMYSFYDDGILLIEQGPPTHTYGDVLVGEGNREFKVEVRYGAGPQPKDSAGENYQAPYPAGMMFRTVNIEGVYPIYATTANIATDTKQPLISMLTGNNIELNLAAESGGNKQRFQLPNAWLATRPITSVQYFNTVSNQWDATNQLAGFAQSQVTVGGVQYTQFKHSGSDRGAIRLRLIF